MAGRGSLEERQCCSYHEIMAMFPGVYVVGTVPLIATSVACVVAEAGLRALRDVLAVPAEETLSPANRPADHKIVFDIPFDSKEIGWSFNRRWTDSRYLDLVSDTTAPYSKPNGIEFGYPSGFSDMVSPARASKAFGPKREIYVAYWARISKPWQYHRSTVNKLFFVGTNANPRLGNEVVITLKGSSEANAQVVVGVQTPANHGVGTRNGYYQPNMSQPGFMLGVWHLIEVRAVQNTSGLPNGKLTWWVDGEMVGHHTNVLFNRSGDAFFDGIILDPNWGGQKSPPKAQRDWIRVDHLLVTGRN
jgi:hypothetical protein